MVVRCNACGHVGEREAAVGEVCERCGRTALVEVARDEPEGSRLAAEREGASTPQCTISLKCEVARRARAARLESSPPSPTLTSTTDHFATP